MQSSKKIIKALKDAGVEIIIVERDNKEKIIKSITNSRNKSKKLRKINVSRSTYYYWARNMKKNNIKKI